MGEETVEVSHAPDSEVSHTANGDNGSQKRVESIKHFH